MSIYTLSVLPTDRMRTINGHETTDLSNCSSSLSDSDTATQRVANTAISPGCLRKTEYRANIHTLSDLPSIDPGYSATNNQGIADLIRKVDSTTEIFDRMTAEQARASQRISDLLNRKEPIKYNDAQIEAILNTSKTLKDLSIFSILFTPVFNIYEFCKKQACNLYSWLANHFSYIK